jgi:hypothetical protein
LPCSVRVRARVRVRVRVRVRAASPYHAVAEADAQLAVLGQDQPARCERRIARPG